MSEHLHLTFGENEFEATPDNTTLFTFLGKAAINGVEFDFSRANHVFFQTGVEDENTIAGSYLFRTDSNTETFDTIASHIAQHDFPMVLNRRDLPQCDYDAYERMLDRQVESQQIGDFLPDEWASDGTT